MKPQTLTDFRRLGKKRLNGRTPEEAKRIHDARKSVINKENISLQNWLRQSNRLKRDDVVLITLSELSIPKPKKYPRVKRWRATIPTYSQTRELCYDCGKYSSRCSYTKYDYQHEVECFAVLIGNNCYYRINGRGGFLFAPKGWKFSSKPIPGTSKNRLAIVNRRGDEYHPDSAEIESGMTGRSMASIARKNAEKRRAIKRESEKNKKDFLANIKCVGVTIRDSMRAGNCAAGTLEFARNSLDYRHEHDNIYQNVRADLLAKIAPSNERVSNAIKSAFDRATTVCI